MKNNNNKILYVAFCLLILFVILHLLKLQVKAKSAENIVQGVEPMQIGQVENTSNVKTLKTAFSTEALEEYLTFKGEQENIDTWFRIIEKESKFDPTSQAPTYWSLCDKPVVVTLWGYEQPANSYIELRDYPNGIWQATCEEFGAKTMETGYSYGLTHILQSTWDYAECKGDINNWMHQIDCSILIRDLQGWDAWSTY